MKFYTVIGEKLPHSWSGPIHELFFRMTGIDGAYKRMEVPRERILDVVDAMKLVGISGMNVTMPYKKTILPSLDGLDELARRVGAVNTLKLEADGRVTGYNSDVYGLQCTLERHGVNLCGGVCAILGGTGGVTSAAAEVMRAAGVRTLYLVSRHPGSDADLPMDCACWMTYDQLPDVRGALLINGTPVGMYPNGDASPVSAEIASHFDAVLDTIYNPLPTLLVKQARSQGRVGIDGFYMLVAQAIHSQEIWQEQTYDVGLIDAIYDELKPKLEVNCEPW
ncbi:MAG: shikimate dehydrogenase [Clostridia bacterium]|nr:shikimate dehydrogenase [Clostridia bacterium]